MRAALGHADAAPVQRLGASEVWEVVERRAADAVPCRPALLAALAERLVWRVEEVEHLCDAWQRPGHEADGHFDLGQEGDPHVIV